MGACALETRDPGVHSSVLFVTSTTPAFTVSETCTIVVDILIHCITAHTGARMAAALI